MLLGQFRFVPSNRVSQEPRQGRVVLRNRAEKNDPNAVCLGPSYDVTKSIQVSRVPSIIDQQRLNCVCRKVFLKDETHHLPAYPAHFSQVFPISVAMNRGATAPRGSQ